MRAMYLPLHIIDNKIPKKVDVEQWHRTNYKYYKAISEILNYDEEIKTNELEHVITISCKHELFLKVMDLLDEEVK